MTTTAFKTTIDWFRVRVQSEPRDALEALRSAFGDHGPSLAFGDLKRGVLGFRNSLSIHIKDMNIGRMDFGGESQRGWVRIDIPGKGCEWVKDWDEIARVQELDKAEIRRLDIALTTWDGEVTHENVVDAHTSGRFISKGRPPALQQIVSSDPRAGRTCNVGAREGADKFFRAYEKGFEMVAKFGLGLSGVGITEIDGKRVEDIYRCELELKAVTRPISWDCIQRRDQYFAGAYPFCSDVLPGVQSDVLMRRPDRAPQGDLAAALANCKTQYGAALFTALTAYQGDIGAVWDQIVGDHHSQALVEAGVLLVDHV